MQFSNKAANNSNKRGKKRAGKKRAKQNMALPDIQERPFRTVKAEGRDARRDFRDRDKRQKLVLANRREGHERLEVRDKPIEHLVHATGWVSELDRLRVDTGATVHSEHQKTVDARQRRWDAARVQRAARQTTLEAAREVHVDKELKERADVAGSGKRNKSSVRYNLLNHVYCDSKSAALAQYRDDKTKYSAVCRSRQLMERGNLCGYDIVSGADRPKLIPDMARPAYPDV